MKGAFRQHFESLTDDRASGISFDWIKTVFGGEKSDTTQGKVRFFSAQLLGRPVQSDEKPYYCISSPNVLSEFADFAKLFGIQLSFPSFSSLPVVEGGQSVYLDDLKTTIVTPAPDFSKIKSFLGDNPGLLANGKFIDLNKSLPVIARNNLENGESKNLWFDEIIPRESRFYFGIMYTTTEENVDLFEKQVVNQIVQVGTNTAIGFGNCLITKIERGN